MQSQQYIAAPGGQNQRVEPRQGRKPAGIGDGVRVQHIGLDLPQQCDQGAAPCGQHEHAA